MSEGIFGKNADLAQRLKDRIAFHANEHRHTYEIGKGVMDALVLEWPRRSARASRRRSSIPYLKAETSSSAPSAVLNLHEQKPESRESVRSVDNP